MSLCEKRNSYKTGPNGIKDAKAINFKNIPFLKNIVDAISQNSENTHTQRNRKLWEQR